MVKSNITIQRKDYLKVINLLNNIESDLKTCKSPIKEDGELAYNLIQNKISSIKNILLEE
jgi:hypothetical protein